MVRQHHLLTGHEFKQTPGDSKGERSLPCCSPWDRKVGHDSPTEQQQSPSGRRCCQEKEAVNRPTFLR